MRDVYIENEIWIYNHNKVHTNAHDLVLKALGIQLEDLIKRAAYGQTKISKTYSQISKFSRDLLFNVLNNG